MNSPASIPTHVAIIMDGNGRWAKQRSLPRIEGHRRGAEAVRRTITAAKKLGVRYVTLYAFSVENWNRPKSEVSGLMSLLVRFLKRETKELIKDEVRLHTIGRIDELPENVREEIARSQKATAHFTQWNLILALNYGARTEILDAAEAYAKTRAANTAEKPLTWETFSHHLYTREFPDPDLLIRTSGETRLSNFLLMQCAYTEMIFSPTLWPDFDESHLRAALEEYGRRERRFGKTSEQINATNKA